MNEIKFTTNVSMKCTEDQYERDLKEPLEKLGYYFERYYSIQDGWLCTNWNKHKNALGVAISEEHQRVQSNYLIDHYNPKLFIALAAMTEGDTPIVGEWMKFIGITGGSFTNNKLYQVKGDFNYCGAFIDDNRKSSGFLTITIKTLLE